MLLAHRKLDICAAAAAVALAATPVWAQRTQHTAVSSLPSFSASSAAAKLPPPKPFPDPQWIFGIKIYVSDLDRSMKFYSDLFDMDILGKAGTGGRAVGLAFKGTHAEQGRAGGGSLTLLINPIPAPVSIPNPAIMITVVDLEAFKRKAASLNVKLTMEGEDAAYGQDPDGNWFKLAKPSYFAAPAR